ncbi:MAG: family oxidoreductase, partial [Devosia sp.]|nr:family oxidoreductase [Devosia sp.]
MQLDFTGKRAVVTGAAQGIGRSIVAALADAGARVVALDLDPQGLLEAKAAGAEHTMTLDLADRSQVQARFAEMVAQPLENVSEHDWHQLFAANVDAAFWCAQAAAPGMKAQRDGRIVTIASGAGLRPSLTGIQAYSSAKHALVGL